MDENETFDCVSITAENSYAVVMTPSQEEQQLALVEGASHNAFRFVSVQNRRISSQNHIINLQFRLPRIAMGWTGDTLAIVSDNLIRGMVPWLPQETASIPSVNLSLLALRTEFQSSNSELEFTVSLPQDIGNDTFYTLTDVDQAATIFADKQFEDGLNLEQGFSWLQLPREGAAVLKLFFQSQNMALQNGVHDFHIRVNQGDAVGEAQSRVTVRNFFHAGIAVMPTNLGTITTWIEPFQQHGQGSSIVSGVIPTFFQ